MTKILGIDISLNHAGFVLSLLDDRSFVYRYVTDRRTLSKKDSKRGTYMEIPKVRDAQVRGVMRIAFWHAYVRKCISELRPTHVVIEDYAYRAAQGAHQLGEIGGIARYYAYISGANVRLHDPGTLKMFAVHDGSADSEQTCNGILSRWPDTANEFEKFGLDDGNHVVSDLCDAYALTKLGETEVMLRDGRLRLDSLPPKEIQVFNRCTKRFPASLLAREWISMSGGTDGA